VNAIPINLVFEDELSETVMEKLLTLFDNKYRVKTRYNARGFGYIKANISGFNEASVAISFFVLTDLDNNPCPISLKTDWLHQPLHPNLIFRVAVKEVESWLLADREGFSTYIGINMANMPLVPDQTPDPKQTLINLVRRSRKRSIKQDIVPKNDRARIGPDYNNRLAEYVQMHWNIDRARLCSDSLNRTIKHLEKFTYQTPY
jgi:hypothetical protein